LTPEGQRDPMLVLMRSASDVLVEVEAFVNSTLGYEVACRVTATRGMARMGDGSFVTRSAANLRGVDVPELWLGRFAEAYRRQLQGWIDHVRTGVPIPGASAWDGYVATHIANRAIDALHAGTPVRISLPARPALYA
ncbi:MAG: hypothetical protein ACKOE2_14295, partial [Actinomycetales bacterium]